MEKEVRLIDANKARVVAQRIYSDPVLIHAILNTLDETPTVDAVEVGSDPTAAGGGNREGSEWQRSAGGEPALSGEGSAGYRNRTHGRWREKILVGGFAEEWGFVCSECGCTVSDRSNLGIGRYASNNQRLNYCPNCGAKMRGDSE